MSDTMVAASAPGGTAQIIQVFGMTDTQHILLLYYIVYWFPRKLQWHWTVSILFSWSWICLWKSLTLCNTNWMASLVYYKPRLCHFLCTFSQSVVSAPCTRVYPLPCRSDRKLWPWRNPPAATLTWTDLQVYRELLSCWQQDEPWQSMRVKPLLNARILHCTHFNGHF